MKDLEKQLSVSFEDFRLSRNEKNALKALLRPYASDIANLAFIRNRAFDIVTEYITASNHHQPGHQPEAMEWLRAIVKVLDSLSQETNALIERAFFSPGPECAAEIIGEIRRSTKSIDVCVFTISDDDISEQLFQAHQRGITVRIITDDDKTRDKGSDIFRLHRAGIPIKTDNDPSHMHHKFAIFDNKRVINGSFNWTRSASTRNHEDITVTSHSGTVAQFCARFDFLWHRFIRIGDL